MVDTSCVSIDVTPETYKTMNSLDFENNSASACSLACSSVSADSANESSVCVRDRAVTFDKVQVYLHDVILGSNPAVSEGLPLELKWDFNDSYSCSVDEFERMNGGRSRIPTRIPAEKREAWLVDNGHSRNSFVCVLQEIDYIKNSRDTSIQQQAIQQEQAEIERCSLVEYQEMANASRRSTCRRASLPPDRRTELAYTSMDYQALANAGQRSHRRASYPPGDHHHSATTPPQENPRKGRKLGIVRRLIKRVKSRTSASKSIISSANEPEQVEI